MDGWMDGYGHRMDAAGEASKDESLPVRGAGYEPEYDLLELTDFVFGPVLPHKVVYMGNMRKMGGGIDIVRLLSNLIGNQEKCKDGDVGPSDPVILDNEDMALRDPFREVLIDAISLDRSSRADKPNELDFILVAH
ncbi:hypothetical protein BHYA_0157g00070 [Botrytis hyacinthi]|uniref:Uncharacterized protein n=1 Tax=Botrytis hyacinthi TaxID=278943 RepID=A0A4Z1GFD6_9HELO|nr:hypothetical protein BHYA_0157g00070 [Botrytis hyacinthi]